MCPWTLNFEQILNIYRKDRKPQKLSCTANLVKVSSKVSLAEVPTNLCASTMRLSLDEQTRVTHQVSSWELAHWLLLTTPAVWPGSWQALLRHRYHTSTCSLLPRSCVKKKKRMFEFKSESDRKNVMIEDLLQNLNLKVWGHSKAKQFVSAPTKIGSACSKTLTLGQLAHVLILACFS